MECSCAVRTSAQLPFSAGGYGARSRSFVSALLELPAISCAGARVSGSSLISGPCFAPAGFSQLLRAVPSSSGPTQLKKGSFTRTGFGASTGAVVTNASKKSSVTTTPEKKEPLEEEVELSWVEEKVEDLMQYTSSVVSAIPGPRVGDGDLPWLLALPIGYVSLSFVIAVVKTVRKYTAPEGKRRRQVGKNAFLVASLSEYLPGKRDELDSNTLKKLARKCQFDLAEVLRKYIRYALNERPFDPELVADLLHLRKVSALDDATVAETLNEVSRRVVVAKGPVIVDTTGFTEKGLKRKVAVQGLFSKILYLAELDEFCSTEGRSSLSIKEIFGVTDEDANLMRIETLSGETEVESLEKLLESTDEEPK